MCRTFKFVDVSACRTMVSQLVEHERIETTLPKAKELRRVADQVVTLGKEVCWYFESMS